MNGFCEKKKMNLLWIYKIGVILKLLWFILNNLLVVYD